MSTEEKDSAQSAREPAILEGEAEIDLTSGVGDSNDVLEIDVSLTDDTFAVQEKPEDHVAIKVRLAPRLKIGVAVVVASFIISGLVFLVMPWALATGNTGLQAWCGYAYLGSWGVLGAGVLIGGPAAKHIVTRWNVRFRSAVKRQILRRRDEDPRLD